MAEQPRDDEQAAGKERLRRYLEQRRELGERELLLDGMSVEDVMKLVGAMGARRAPADQRPERGAPLPWSERSTDELQRRADASAIEPVVGADLSSPGSPDAPRRTPNPAASQPPADAVRETPAGGDWREMLRASGSAPDQLRREARSGSPAPAPAQPASVAAPTPAPDSRAAGPSAGDDDAGMEPSPAPGAAAGADGAPEQPTLPGGDEWAIAGIDVPVGLVVGARLADLGAGPMDALATLEELAATVAACTRCPLYATAINPVPGEGDPNAGLMCVGEAPGQSEDETGRPFVGASGQLLTKILAAIKLSRDDVFIANVIKHRPPGNRNPLPNEVAACSPYLVRQLELVRPKVIIAFGTFAAQTLLNTKTPIGKLRGAVHRYYGIPLIVTYHPAALLRNEAWKRPTWEDVKLARRILDSATGA